MSNLVDHAPTPADTPPPDWPDPFRGALALYRARPRLWLLLALPTLLGGLPATPVRTEATMPPPAFIVAALTMIAVLGSILSVVGLVAYLALDVAMARQATGRPIDRLGEAFQRVVARLIPLAALGCLTGVAFLVAMVLTMALLRVAHLAAAPELNRATPALIILIGLVLVDLRLGFTINAVVLASDGLAQGIRRSYRLTAGRVVRWAGYMAVIWGPEFLLTLAGIAQLAVSREAPPWWLTMAGSLVSFLWLPVQSGVRVLAFYRFRAEAEGLTVAEAEAELTGPGRPRAERPAQRHVGPPPGEAWEPPTTQPRRRRRSRDHG